VPHESISADFTISATFCLNSSKALVMLGEGSTNLVVIDWEGDAS
jgi:hypothetical protein